MKTAAEVETRTETNAFTSGRHFQPSPEQEDIIETLDGINSHLSQLSEEKKKQEKQQGKKQDDAWQAEVVGQKQPLTFSESAKQKERMSEAEKYNTRTVRLPPASEFVFVNVGSSGVETPWHAVLLTDTPWTEIVKHEQEEMTKRRKVKEEQLKNKEALSDEELKKLGRPNKQDQEQTRRDQLHARTLYTEVDGDGVLPVSMFNPGFKTDVVFEIRGATHTGILRSRALFNIISAIEGLPMNTKEQEEEEENNENNALSHDPDEPPTVLLSEESSSSSADGFGLQLRFHSCPHSPSDARDATPHCLLSGTGPQE